MTEHLNEPEGIDDNDEYETVTVSLSNVAEVAHRSGKDEQTLRKMLMIKHVQGQDLRVRYKVVNDSKPTPIRVRRKRKFWRKGKK